MASNISATALGMSRYAALAATTTKPGSSDKPQIPFRYILYIFVGLGVATANLLIFFTIVLSKELRAQKQYAVIGGLALFDAVNGVACFIAGW